MFTLNLSTKSLNSTVVPLFEKVLSASDASRIGHVVLPKACAEAYFPPISQSEGIPIKIQDIKGKEWTFQFRFWPNNKSRMSRQFWKSIIFTSRASGEQEQWAQCDSCFEWRRLHVDVLIPPKWACLDNIWDPSRCSCSAPDEMNPQELKNLLGVGNDFKKLRIIESTKVDKEHEPSRLDALANAAVLEDIANDLGEPSAGTTTKHPCDHSGCSCIVCIQLPSGKGKHKSTCTSINQSEDKSNQKNIIPKHVGETSKGCLDLNCQPSREEDTLIEATNLNMRSLVREARHSRLENIGPCLLSQAVGEIEGYPLDEACSSSLAGEHENEGSKR
ncbi:B3 domain-containing transcription repressor VAL1 [Camellia lanceoleosa]|uniref:B3 domain-containing transcription repressor VAL1 n=1 Tax=Camellia lanceoleosa TaxID=1840588 RepID=A0ACC0F5P8_9ERIC|nr:B3 domain-containing transcription repressor VAL1 [Camellia lanceoleosa]